MRSEAMSWEFHQSTYEIQVALKGRDFLTLADFNERELSYLLSLASDLKQTQKRGQLHHALKGKTLGMIFEKASTRTRVSFEAGIYQLGGQGMFLSHRDLQLRRGEPVSDTAKVLSRYLDGLMIRTYSQDEVVELAKNADIPVINGLTDLYHPCQVMADFQTIMEKKGSLKGLKLAYVGDGNNMAHSLLLGAALMGINISVAAPTGYQPNASVVEQAKMYAEFHGSDVEITDEPQEAVEDADVVYTDVWASMGQEEEHQQRVKLFHKYQVNDELTRYAKEDYLFMHCLPAHRGEEVTTDIIDGKHAVVFDQAENRLHAQKAIMMAVMG